MQKPGTDQLLEHGRFLRALACSLLDAPGRADDIVQETWLAALRKPPKSGVPLGAWLAAVVRNRVRRLRRNETRRRRREQAAARPGWVRSTLDLVEVETIRREVVEAVLGLGEPYRTVILLRFYDDLPPREIAKQLGLPGSTVRTMLQRALRRLRGKLDATREGGRRSWCLALVPVAAARAKGSAFPASVVGGFAAMGTTKVKLAIAALILALAGVGAAVWPRADRRARDHSGTWRTADANKSRDDGVLATHAAAGPGRPEGGKTEEGTRAPTLLRGRLLVPPETPAAAAQVTVRAVIGKLDRSGASATGRSGEDLTFTVDVAGIVGTQGTRELEVRVDHPFCLPAATRVPVHRSRAGVRLDPMEIRLARAAVVRGLVVGPEGPLAGTRVGLLRILGSDPGDLPVDEGVTGEDGRYLLRAKEDGLYLVAAVQEGYLAAARSRELRVAQVIDAAPLRMERGATLSGRVSVNGEPAPGARVAAAPARGGHLLGWEQLLWSRRTLTRGRISAKAGKGGRFRIEGLETGPCSVAVTRLPDAHPDAVRDESGKPLALSAFAPATGVELDLSLAYLRIRLRAGGRPTAGNGTLGHYHISIGAEGRVLGVRPGAEYEIEAGVTGYRRQKRTVRAPAAAVTEEVAFDLVPQEARGTIFVTLAAAAGDPECPIPEQAAFALFPAEQKEGRPEADWLASREKGLFRLERAPAGPHRLVMNRSRSLLLRFHDYLPVDASVVVRPDEPARVTLRIRRGGRLRVAAYDRQGHVLEAACTLVDDAGRRVPVRFGWRDGPGWLTGPRLGGRGPCDVEKVLEPGRYRLEFACEGFEDTTAEVDLKRGATRLVEVELAPR